MTRIAHTDIRVGDKIEVRETLTVTHVGDNRFGEVHLRYAEAPERSFSLLDKSEVILLDRLPMLPTRLGSVVTITSRSGLDSGTWMLTTDGWVSNSNSVMPAAEFARRIRDAGYTIMVVK